MASALICDRCGAPLPAAGATASVTCSYCGTTHLPAPQVIERVVQVVLGAGALASEEALARATGLKCPRCGEPFHVTRAEGHAILACRTCGGVFLETAAVERLKAAADEAILYAASRAVGLLMPYRSDRRAALRCPHCQTELVRSDLGETGRSVDSCALHGTFFDRGEVQTFASYRQELRAGEISDEDLSSAGLPTRGWFGKG